MEKLITFLKTEFPKEALEVQECIDLLNQSIDGSIDSIKNAFGVAIDQRDFVKIYHKNLRKKIFTYEYLF